MNTLEQLIEEENKLRDIPTLPKPKTEVANSAAVGQQCLDQQCKVEVNYDEVDEIKETTLFDVNTIPHLSYDELVETTHKAIGIYSIAPVYSVLMFFVGVIPLIPFELRLDCIEILIGCPSTLARGLVFLDKEVSNAEFAKLHTAQRFEYYVLLLVNGYWQHLHALYDIINDKSLDEKYRFRLLQSASRRLPEYTASLFKQFFDNSTNGITIRILASKPIITDVEVANTIYGWMDDEELPHHIRADCADTLLNSGMDEYSKDAIQVLRQLGGGNTIYENKENVHFTNVNAVQLLQTVMKATVKEPFEDIAKHFSKEAMERIEFDQTIISNTTLREFFVHLYAFICEHESKEELLKILKSELEDSVKTCTSGYFMRLVNVLSGFDGFSVKVNWEEQIRAYLFLRFNQLLMTHPSKDTILEQMTNRHLADRIQFSTFFAENISAVKEELYREFCDYLTDDEWEMAFKEALTNYQN